jgi:hypothetical protein
VYTSRATKDKFGPFEWLARFGRFNGDWRAARDWCYQKAGVEPFSPSRDGSKSKPKAPAVSPAARPKPSPKPEPNPAAKPKAKPAAKGERTQKPLEERFDWHDTLGAFGQGLQAERVAAFCEANPGISAEAVEFLGGRSALYPKDAPGTTGNNVIAFAVSPRIRSPRPTRMLILGSSGQKLRIYRGPDEPVEHAKVATIKRTPKSKAGWVGTHWQRLLPKAEICWKVEGPKDALALQAAIFDAARRTDDPEAFIAKHVVLSNSNGANEEPKDYYVNSVAGKVVFVVGDADEAGQGGAARWAEKLAKKAAEVRNVKLPYEVWPDHGRDLRDYFREEDNSFETLLELAGGMPQPASGGAEFACAETPPPDPDDEADDGGDDGDPDDGGDDDDDDDDTPRRPPYEADWIDNRAFFGGNYRLTWHVKKIMVGGQPFLIAGPPKTLKTTIAADLVISLAGGTPFLQVFDVPEPVAVAFLNGESGEAVLQETAKRICKAKGIADPEKLPIWWGFTLPRLASPTDVAAVAEAIGEKKIKVLVIDPAYLCLLAGAEGRQINAANHFEVGPLLLAIAEACKEADCTPVLIHHTRKNMKAPHNPLGLEEIAWAGFAEFGRQWLMINPRERYVPGSGKHSLWLNAGGSAGQGGEWALEVYEGTLKDDFTGRVWDTEIKEAGVARGQASEGRKKRVDDDDEAKLLAGFRKLLARKKVVVGGGVPSKDLRPRSSLDNKRFAAALARLEDQGVLEVVKVPNGKGGGRPVEVIRWPSDDDEGTGGINGKTGGANQTQLFT